MFRLKTQPDEQHDKLNVGCNGLLAAVKAQQVANDTGLVVVLERHEAPGWAPDEVMFPHATGTPSKRFQP